MTTTAEFIATLTDEEKNTMLLDLTEITFSLAVSLRTLEVFAETDVEYADITGTEIDFSNVGIMLLTLRGDENGEHSPLTSKAIEALSHPRVDAAITKQLGEYAEQQFGLPLNDLNDEGLQEIIDAIEEAIGNGDLTRDTLSKYL